LINTPEFLGIISLGAVSKKMPITTTKISITLSKLLK